MAVWGVWLQFLGCMALIGVAGVQLSRQGEAIASLTGLSRGWIGLVLVATVTSLPELVTGLGAVRVAQAPDLAAGDALGSCVFNLLIVGLVDGLYRRGRLFVLASADHVLSAAFGVGALALVMLALWLEPQGRLPALGSVSPVSVVLVLLYFVAVRTLFRAQARSDRPPEPGLRADRQGLRRALLAYGLAALIIVAAGLWLPMVGAELARQMGWTDSLVGTLLMAMATSVPELAATLGALRVGAVDLALGNLLGSNLFDLLILAIDDFAYAPGSLFAHLSPVHGASVLVAILMNAVVVGALTFRPDRRVWGTASTAGVVLVLLYGLNGLLQAQALP
ncbi:sodium:calcium antiporter [Ideonella sp. B7]|nr:sodium:calcium antiporter [Ideonella benzenivorans]